jgi:hypothetical protein
MDNDDTCSNSNRRIIEDRRSGADTRLDTEKQLIGERRSAVDRRSERKNIKASVRPPNEQLALFARRLRRALGSERGREFFGVARGEYDFSIYPDVLRTLEWLERSAIWGTEGSAQPENLEKINIRRALSCNETSEK